jgi:hypothetical protein
LCGYPDISKKNITNARFRTLAKADIKEILDDNSTMKQNTAQILGEILRLQRELTRETRANNPPGYTLERYLDSLTKYAESVCSNFPDSMPIDDKPEGSAVSESKATPPRNLKPFPNPRSDDLEV